MDASPPPDLSSQLPRSMYYQLVHTLRDALPPVSDAPEDIARRDHAAIAQVASMLPANADEANLAAQCVAASARSIDCMRLANEYRTADHSFALKCDARAATMMRQARGARSLLLRVQAAREKREADPAAADRAAWTEHCAIGLMADALTDAPWAAASEPPPPPAHAAPDPVPDQEPQPDLAAAAEQYTVVHPRQAAQIRTLGRLPETVMPGLEPTIGPPSPELVHAIVTGTSPALRALDSSAQPAATG